jgi:serine protease
MPRKSACRNHLYRSRRLCLELLEDRSLLSTAASAVTVQLGGLTINQSGYSTSHVLVEFRPGVVPFALPGTNLGQAVAADSGMYQENLLAGTTVSQALSEYAANPAVAAEQPDYNLTPSWIPNDPLLSNQWDMNNTGQQGGTRGDDIGAPAAWGIATGSYRSIVAVIDTGIDYTDQDLYDNIWINQAAIPASRLKNLVDVYHDGFISMRDLNSPINQGPGKIMDLNHNGYIDAGDLLQPMILNNSGQDTGLGGWVNPRVVDPADGLVGDIVGWNFSGNNDNPYDDVGHGTHVAGTIGAMGNNGVGIAGINWYIQLMPLKVFDAQSNGTISSAISALDYATAHGARISNNSWDGAGNDPLLQDAIARAQAKGDIFVAAAGNGGTNTDVNPDYPADFTLSNIVSVAATDNKNNLAGFSNYGAVSVDIAAPGVNTYSTLPGNHYGTMSGTSMAAPHVTGVLALVWSLRPEWTYQQVIAQVMNTVTKVPALAGKVASGGIVNAAAAIKVPPRTTATTVSNPTVIKTTSTTKTSNAQLHPAGVSDFAPSAVSATTNYVVLNSPAASGALGLTGVEFASMPPLLDNERPEGSTDSSNTKLTASISLVVTGTLTRPDGTGTTPAQFPSSESSALADEVFLSDGLIGMWGENDSSSAW